MNFIKQFLHRWYDFDRKSERSTKEGGQAQNRDFYTILHAEYQWRKTRNEFIRANPNCAICGYGKKIEVHHIHPWSLFPGLRYDFSNLISLCDACHFRFGHGLNWKKWNPEVNGLAYTAKSFLDDIRDDAEED